MDHLDQPAWEEVVRLAETEPDLKKTRDYVEEGGGQPPTSR
jgi:hypothetical protein